MSRYCAPPDKTTGCGQCDLNLRQQCNQTFYLKEQNEILRGEQADVREPAATTTQIANSESQINLSPQYQLGIYLVGGIVIGFVLSILVLKLYKYYD